MATHSVAFHGLPKSAEASARSMLKLVLPMLLDSWRIGEAIDSDVVILEAAALHELNRAGAARSNALYVVFESRDPQPDNAFCTVRKPLSSSALIEALHKARSELERGAGGIGEITNVASRFAQEDPELRGTHATIRTAIRWALQDQANASTLMSRKEGRILTVLPGKGYSTRLRASAIADLIRSNVQVMLLVHRSDEQVEMSNKLHKLEPMAKLERIFWLTGSNGELRPELRVSKPYRLRRWPNFGLLPHYRADVRMASLLKVETLTVGELASRAGVQLETACNFVDACHSLKLLESARARSDADNTAGADPQPSGADEQGVAISEGPLASLRSAINVGGASLRSALGLGGSRLGSD